MIEFSGRDASIFDHGRFTAAADLRGGVTPATSLSAST
jgi:hypothetical protein